MSTRGPITEGVALSLEAPEMKFAPGAEIILTARLMNYSSEPMRVVITTVWLDYDVQVAREGEGDLSPTALAVQRRESALEGRRIARDLKSRETLDEQIPLSAWFDLSRPGRYRVVASRSVHTVETQSRNLTVRSNELVLEVRNGDAGEQP
jgi:hypothetical protein